MENNWQFLRYTQFSDSDAKMSFHIFWWRSYIATEVNMELKIIGKAVQNQSKLFQ